MAKTGTNQLGDDPPEQIPYKYADNMSSMETITNSIKLLTKQKSAVADVDAVDNRSNVIPLTTAFCCRMGLQMCNDIYYNPQRYFQTDMWWW